MAGALQSASINQLRDSFKMVWLFILETGKNLFICEHTLIE